MKYRSRKCLTNSCEGLSREERSCSCSSFLNDNRFTFFHLILISLISFLFGCLLILCIYGLCCRYEQKFLHKDEQKYFQGSTSSPNSDLFTTLSNSNNNQIKFRSFDSSSILTTNGNNYLKDIPSRNLNMYINPLPPSATLKRLSLMSSMKTNLDAEDL
jgi:hypothetical protein